MSCNKTFDPKSISSMSLSEVKDLQKAIDLRMKDFSNRKILALYSPYPAAGKTTIAWWLTHTWRYFGRIVSFAQPLKEMANIIWNYQDGLPKFNYNTCKDTPIHQYADDTPRDIICTLGKALRERYGQAFFANLLYHTLQQNKDTNIVIDDMRLLEEYEMLESVGAKFIRVVVPDRTITTTETEGRLESCCFDAEIVNRMDGLYSLYEDVDKVVYDLW